MSTSSTRPFVLPSGTAVPVLGQGTWRMGEDAGRRVQEIAALRLGLDLGLSLIDTAEMYGDGGAERVTAEVIQGRRDTVYLVSKVLPSNASRRGTVAACERSLRRLGTDYLDLYLLHWRGGPALEETLEGFADLIASGKIRAWGVSNFDVDDTAELADLPGGTAAATNQVLYNLTRRGIEFDLAPAWQRYGAPLMAYSPIEQGRLLGHPVLRKLAEQHQASPAQIALAWVLSRPNVIAIPKATGDRHVRDNRRALDLRLGAADLAELDAAFPPPTRARPLEMI